MSEEFISQVRTDLRALTGKPIGIMLRKNGVVQKKMDGKIIRVSDSDFEFLPLMASEAIICSIKDVHGWVTDNDVVWPSKQKEVEKVLEKNCSGEFSELIKGK